MAGAGAVSWELLLGPETPIASGRLPPPLAASLGGGGWLALLVSHDATGLAVSLGGIPLLAGFPLAGWAPLPTWRVSIGACGVVPARRAVVRA